MKMVNSAGFARHEIVPASLCFTRLEFSSPITKTQKSKKDGKKRAQNSHSCLIAQNS